MAAEEFVVMDGPYCPFLTCTKPTPHRHHVCESCGAVRYGNSFLCETCRRRSVELGDER